MRSAVLKRIILASALIIVSLVVVQLIWLYRQYHTEQRLFNSNVIKSIRELYLDLPLTTDRDTKLGEKLERVNESSYLFRVDMVPERDTLVQNIIRELENFDVFTECKMAYYDHHLARYQFEYHVPATASRRVEEAIPDLEIYPRNYSYVLLSFPNRNSYFLQGLWLWVILSVLLILALLALSISIFFLYKQKFLNEIQKDFINNVTHEFQTPLTTLQLGLEALNNPGIADNPDKISKYTGIMLAQTDYLRHHLENLMLVIRADARVLNFQKEPINMNHLIKEAVSQLSVVAAEKQAVFNLKLEPLNREIMADRSNIFLVLLNLISNAIKYSRNPIIDITTRVDGHYYEVCVKDNGIGIDPKYRKNLFHRFYRVPSGNLHDTKGLGLGLYFVKQITEMHKGTIDFESEPLKGTKFILTLPID